MDDQNQAAETPLIEQLRGIPKFSDGWRVTAEKPDDPMAGCHMLGNLVERAADELERLRAENEALRKTRREAMEQAWDHSWRCYASGHPYAKCDELDAIERELDARERAMLHGEALMLNQTLERIAEALERIAQTCETAEARCTPDPEPSHEPSR